MHVYDIKYFFNLKPQDFKCFGLVEQSSALQAGCCRRYIHSPFTQEDGWGFLRVNAFPLLLNASPGLTWALFLNRDLQNKNNNTAEKRVSVILTIDTDV